MFVHGGVTFREVSICMRYLWNLVTIDIACSVGWPVGRKYPIDGGVIKPAAVAVVTMTRQDSTSCRGKASDDGGRAGVHQRGNVDQKRDDERHHAVLTHEETSRVKVMTQLRPSCGNPQSLIAVGSCQSSTTLVQP